MPDTQKEINDEARKKLGDMLDKAIGAHLAGDESLDIDGLDDLKVQIRIDGPRWGGFMNKTTADFLLKLEERMRMIYEEAGLPIPSEGIVEMRVTEGSWFSEIDLSKLADFLNKMEPKQIAYTLGAVSVAMCIWQIPEIIEKATAVKIASIEAESKKDALEARVDEEEIEAKTIQRIVEILAPVEKQARDLQSPIRSIVKKLDKADTIQVSGMDEAKSKKKFTESRIEKGVRNKPEKPRVDLLYIIEGISTVKGKKWKASLRWGEEHFTATIDLDIVDLAKFLKVYEEATPNSDLTQNLHVNLKISGGIVREASIVGLGDSREGAISLDQALKGPEE